jgi:SAM-dependent methyltransferase
MESRLRPHLTSLRREWNGSGAIPDPRVAARYMWNGEVVPGPVLDALSRDIASHLDLSPRDLLLDAGCGSGVHYRNLAPRVRQAVGVDLSMSMLAHLPRPGVNADVGSLPFRGECFDKILCFGVLQYALDESHADTLVTELLRVLRPDGRVFLGFIPNAETPDEWSGNVSASDTAKGRWRWNPFRRFRRPAPPRRRNLRLAPGFFDRFSGTCRVETHTPTGYPELQYHLRFDALLTKLPR